MGGVEAAKRDLLRMQALALENGEGIQRDPVAAAKLYCEAARLGDAASQFNLAWMYSNGRGVDRSDQWAAFFFHAAAEQGYEQAQRMLAKVGGPPTYVPDCMREPDPPKIVKSLENRVGSGSNEGGAGEGGAGDLPPGASPGRSRRG